MPGTIAGSTAPTGPLLTKTESNPCRTPSMRGMATPAGRSRARRNGVRPRLPQGGAEHGGTACDRDSRREEQSTTKRRATETPAGRSRARQNGVRPRLPFRGGAKHDETACDRDSPLGEEQSTTEWRAATDGSTALTGPPQTKTGNNPPGLPRKTKNYPRLSSQ